MFPALSDSARRALTLLSMICCSSAIALLPLAGESSLQPQPLERSMARIPDGTESPSELRFPDITVDRDPFVAERRAVNVSTKEAPAGTAAGPVVRAIILGARAKALVEDGGVVRVVGVGDPVGTSTVQEISRTAVVLEDGRSLQLTEATPQ